MSSGDELTASLARLAVVTNRAMVKCAARSARRIGL